MNRGNGKTDGSVFFRAKNGLADNPKGLADSLKQRYYRYPALSPAMVWHDAVEPYMPRALRYEAMNGAGPAALFWDLPYTASDGDSAWMYAVYAFDHNPNLPGELDDARNLLAVGHGRTHAPPIPMSGPRYYVVTALDRSGNESLWSSVVAVSAPAVPVLASPAQDALAPTDTVKLLWRSSVLAARYRLQVSTDSGFSASLFFQDSTVVDTFRIVRGLVGRSVYYWRVRAENAGGVSSYSLPNTLRADFPLASGLSYPPNYTVNMPLTLTLRWRSSAAASSYRLQISQSSNFGSTFADSSGITDTSCMLNGLQSFTIYYWRIKAVNTSGSSGWSAPWGFRTVSAATVHETPSLPTEYELGQNYPNPFNPIAEIGFRIAEGGDVTLIVYDILGREVAVLVDEQMQPGSYSVRFDGSRIASGVYIYRLQAGRFVATKRMILLR